jgi:GNAT superfamily N-acetyltransferase
MNSCSTTHEKSHDKDAAKTFLAISNSDGKTIFGFYSLCPASLEYARVPDIVRMGLARHDVPVFRLGRLAVSGQFQGQGMGGQLILAAGRRCLLAATEVGGVVILIDAKSRASSKMVCLVRSGCPFGRATFTALATRNDSGCT